MVFAAHTEWVLDLNVTRGLEQAEPDFMKYMVPVPAKSHRSCKIPGMEFRIQEMLGGAQAVDGGVNTHGRRTLDYGGIG